MAPPNVTGFDPQKFAASSGLPKNDPWLKNEAWRYSGPFTRWNRFRGTLPGLGIATGAFAVYLVYDAVSNHGQHEKSHGGGHH